MAKNKENATCPYCKKQIEVNDINCEKIGSITIVYCECGQEFEV